MDTNSNNDSRSMFPVVVTVVILLMLLPALLMITEVRGWLAPVFPIGNIWAMLLVLGIWTMLVGALAVLAAWVLGIDRRSGGKIH
jgi:hypothetical protein